MSISHQKSYQEQNSLKEVLFKREKEKIQMAKGELKKAHKGQKLALSDRGEEPIAQTLRELSRPIC